MRVLLISDIHSNYRALRAVLDAHAGDADEVWCLGDVVSWGPCPIECLDLVAEHCRYVVVGNHDLEPGALPLDANDRYRTQIASWPRSLTAQCDGRSFLLTHYPPEHSGYLSLATPQEVFDEIAEGFSEGVMLVGHSHTAMVVDLPGGKRLVNVGTVGQVRDGDPRAQCMVMADGEFSFHRVAYDLDAYEADCRRTKLMGGLTDTLIKWTRQGWVDVHGLQIGPFSEKT